MARRTKQEAEETRSSILNAALDIIYDKGYARSTFVDIAKRIRLSKGAVYWHFKSKPDLFLALSHEMEERIDTTLGALFNEAGNLDELKHTFLEIILLIAKDDQLRKYYTIVFSKMEWTEELLPVKRFFERQDSSMMDWVIELLSNAQKMKAVPGGKDVTMVARALLELVNGLLSYCLNPPGHSINSAALVVQVGLDTFFTGMQVNEKQLKPEASV